MFALDPKQCSLSSLSTWLFKGCDWAIGVVLWSVSYLNDRSFHGMLSIIVTLIGRNRWQLFQQVLCRTRFSLNRLLFMGLLSAKTSEWVVTRHHSSPFLWQIGLQLFSIVANSGLSVLIALSMDRKPIEFYLFIETNLHELHENNVEIGSNKLKANDVSPSVSSAKPMFASDCDKKATQISEKCLQFVIG